MYEYKVRDIIKIYDGDTVTITIDLGFGIYKTDNFRLSGLDAPEVRGVERPDGLISRDWLRARLEGATEKDFRVKTFKDKKGKYGRYIAELFIDGVSINLELITEGLAEARIY